MLGNRWVFTVVLKVFHDLVGRLVLIVQAVGTTAPSDPKGKREMLTFGKLATEEPLSAGSRH